MCTADSLWPSSPLRAIVLFLVGGLQGYLMFHVPVPFFCRGGSFSDVIFHGSCQCVMEVIEFWVMGSGSVYRRHEHCCNHQGRGYALGRFFCLDLFYPDFQIYHYVHTPTYITEGMLKRILRVTFNFSSVLHVAGPPSSCMIMHADAP